MFIEYGVAKMGNQQGTAVYVNDQQYQRSANTDGLRTFFGEMRLNKDGEFLDNVKYVFQNGSQNRSYFFANIRYKDYSSSYERGLSYMMPFYGVKGRISAITARVSLYSELLVCKENELAGMGFTDRIFGTDYMRDSEGVAESKQEVIAVMQRDKIPVRHSVGEKDRELVCKVASKLWEAQENDPSTRFIILLSHAQERSMDLLQNIYMLLPHELRLLLGFETNITEKDLKIIQEQNGFPIYVLTAETGETFETDSYSFPIVIYDLNKCDEYVYDENKLKILRTVADGMNDLDAVLLDYSEKKVLEGKNERYSSFANYGEYVTNMNNVNYWWRSADITSVEELKSLYDDQKELLNNDNLKKEAINEFLVSILPQDKLSDQLAEIAVDENYRGRKELLKFLSEELYQKTQVNALTKACAAQNRKDAALMEEKDKAYEGQILILKEEHGMELQAEKQKSRKLAAANKTYEEKLASAEQENEKLGKHNRALKKKLDEMEQAESIPDKGNRGKVKELRETLKTLRIVTVVCAVLLVGALAFGIVSMMSSSKLKSQIAETEQQLQSETKKAEDASEKVIELEEKIKQLEVEQEEKQKAEQDLVDEQTTSADGTTEDQTTETGTGQQTETTEDQTTETGTGQQTETTEEQTTETDETGAAQEQQTETETETIDELQSAPNEENSNINSVKPIQGESNT